MEKAVKMSLVLKLRCSIRDLFITCPGTKASLQKLGHTAKMAVVLVFVQIELELWLPWQHIRFNSKKRYVAMAKGRLYNLCQSCPWRQMVMTQGTIVYIDLL